MYGAILGDIVGFPYEYRQEDLTDREIPLLKTFAGTAVGADRAGDFFSEKTVLTAALQDGLLSFEKKIPELFSGKAGAAGLDSGGKESPGNGDSMEASGKPGKETSLSRNTFEHAAAAEISDSLRHFGGLFPLAGYAMDLSIWLFRDGAKPSENEDQGPAARVSPVAWIFQDDLYMMRRMAVLQAGITNINRETLKAADAAACMVFLAIHGCTKSYIAGYLEKTFGYRTSGFEEMKKELAYADYSGGGMSGGNLGIGEQQETERGTEGGSSPASNGGSLPALYVRAALTAFLHGRDFEDVLRLAVSLCGSRIDTAAVASIAGAAAEAFFGVPDSLRNKCRELLPPEIRDAADAFFGRVEEKKKARELDPALMARWESALTRATEGHPAAVHGNETLEKAIEEVQRTRNQQALIAALNLLRARASANGRVYVPAVAVKRPEKGESVSEDDSSRSTAGSGAAGPGAGVSVKPENSSDNMTYRLQAVRTKDGKLWQPAFTSREELEKSGAGKGLVLSYSIKALLTRFLSGNNEQKMPDIINGVVLNPGGKVLFLPRVTIDAIMDQPLPRE